MASQIKQDLEEFASEFGQSDFAMHGPLFISGARQGYFGASDWLEDISHTFDGIQLVVLDVSELRHSGDQASATVNYKFQLQSRAKDYIKGNGGALKGWRAVRQEEVRFRREPRLKGNPVIWKIVPPAAWPGALTTARETPQNANFWSIVAYYLSQQQPYPRVISLAERSTRKLKFLGLGALMFNSDYDDHYALDARYIISEILPYIKDVSYFLVPDTNETYAFNANLSDRKTTKDWEFHRIVLFYEGQNQKPIFRYEGKAAICFADGHVALVTPEEAQKLIWKP